MNYDELAANYAAHRAADPAVVAALCSAVTETSHVLEVGCGTGNYIAAVEHATGARCSGVDPSREMLAYARERTDRVELVTGIAEALPFPADSFDLVFSIEVFHHLGDFRSAIVEAFRALRAGGRLCIGTEDEEIIRGRAHARYFPETNDVDLARYPSIPALRDAMSAAGFVDLREERTASQYRITDSRPYRDKADSSLLLIPDDAFGRGIERLEHDLERGPIDGVARQLLLWGTAP